MWKGSQKSCYNCDKLHLHLVRIKSLSSTAHIWSLHMALSITFNQLTLSLQNMDAEAPDWESQLLSSNRIVQLRPEMVPRIKGNP